MEKQRDISTERQIDIEKEILEPERRRRDTD
jgi:hypothetical protein